jgi:flagellar basal-body rod protein FlgB
MAWIDGLFQRETVPVLESSLGFHHQRQLAIANNIANVETPYYQRQEVPEGEFRQALQRAIEERETAHPNRFEIRDSWNVRFPRGNYPVMDRLEGQEFGPERHDENSVVIEKEMADLSENTLMIQTLQRLMKKKLTTLRMAAAERVA